jgi:regulator of protease activity HflC (stomatin/prohibitin superfamily)
MKITRKRLNKIRKMKYQSARKNRNKKRKNKKRTLRSRKVNLKKSTMRHKRGGAILTKAKNLFKSKKRILAEKVEQAENFLTTQIENLSLQISGIKSDQKITNSQVNTLKSNIKKNSRDQLFIKNPSLENEMKQEFFTLRRKQKNLDKSLSQKEKILVNLKKQLSNIKNSKDNAKYAEALKKANTVISQLNQSARDALSTPVSDLPSKSTISAARGVPSTRSKQNVVTTIVKSLKDNKGNIVSPGYIVDVIHDPDGVSASTGALLMSDASTRTKSLTNPVVSSPTSKPAGPLTPAERQQAILDDIKSRNENKSKYEYKMGPDSGTIEFEQKNLGKVSPLKVNSLSTSPREKVIKLKETKSRIDSRKKSVESKESKTRIQSKKKKAAAAAKKKKATEAAKKKKAADAAKKKKAAAAAKKKKAADAAKKKKAADAAKKKRNNSESKQPQPATNRTISRLIKNFQSKKLKVILSRLKAPNKRGTPQQLKADIIDRFNKTNKMQLYNYLKTLNRLDNVSIKSSDSKIKMFSLFINLIKSKTHKDIGKMRKNLRTTKKKSRRNNGGIDI